MGLIKSLEDSRSAINIRLSSLETVTAIEVSQGIALITKYLERVKKELSLTQLQNEVDKYVVYKSSSFFFYIGFVTPTVIKYYNDNNKRWMIPKVTTGEYGNYFTPLDKNRLESCKVYRMMEGRIYVPEKSYEFYEPLLKALAVAMPHLAVERQIIIQNQPAIGQRNIIYERITAKKEDFFPTAHKKVSVKKNQLDNLF